MKISCWNVRGFHKPLKQRGVQYFMDTHKIDIFGILESKFDEKMLRINFRGLIVVHNFQNTAKGRIFLLWNPNTIHVDVLSMSDQAIHTIIVCRRTRTTFNFSFIYGFNTIVQRKDLWENLKCFGNNCTLPWILFGDFNNVLSQNEKSGGLRVTNYDTKDFTDCFTSLDLAHLKSIGCKFTWMSPAVCCKLDHVLVNQYWLRSNLNGIAEFIAPGCISDHTLSLVSFLQPEVKRKKTFKFFNMWTLCEDYFQVVESN